jgi:hypothetical protein
MVIVLGKNVRPVFDADERLEEVGETQGCSLELCHSSCMNFAWNSEETDAFASFDASTSTAGVESRSTEDDRFRRLTMTELLAKPLYSRGYDVRVMRCSAKVQNLSRLTTKPGTGGC